MTSYWKRKVLKLLDEFGGTWGFEGSYLNIDPPPGFVFVPRNGAHGFVLPYDENTTWKEAWQMIKDGIEPCDCDDCVSQRESFEDSYEEEHYKRVLARYETWRRLKECHERGKRWCKRSRK